MASNLCTDIGYYSLNHYGEQLCGDNVRVAHTEDNNEEIVVLADGLGSGVKANILSTLTSTIISTMFASGMNLDDTVKTVIDTLPICSERKIAYSTFSILRIIDNRKAQLINYDNPDIIMMRDGKNYPLDLTYSEIAGKKLSRTEVDIQENDVFILMSDGVEHAGVGISYNFGWEHKDIINFVSQYMPAGFTAKTLTTVLINETNRLYDSKCGDDATVCTVRIRKREPVNLIIGPPSNRGDANKMMALFFAKEGKHIVCGGTTSTIAAKYLHEELYPDIDYPDHEIPPTATLKGCDLVTEGVVTINRVLQYAQNYLDDNSSYEKWCYKLDGASRIARMLFEDATDINFFVGRAVNPAHQNSALPINFTIKMQLVKELSECLQKMGKKIIVSYF